MATDPLSMLRQYVVDKRLDDVREEQDQIIFGGETAFRSDANTNFTQYNPAGVKQYYTIGTLLFYMRREELSFYEYTKEALAEGKPVVRVMDRKNLVDYLTGALATVSNIDRTAPVEVPLPISAMAIPSKTAVDDSAEASGVSAAKKPRTDPSSILSGTNAKVPLNSKSSLPEAIPLDKIAILKTKILSRRTQPGQGGVQLASNVMDDDLGDENAVPSTSRDDAKTSVFEKGFESQEKVAHTRLSILRARSNLREFALHALKSLQTQQQRAQETTIHENAAVANNTGPNQTTGALTYNRYIQDQFTNRNESLPFNIDVSGSNLANLSSGLHNIAGAGGSMSQHDMAHKNSSGPNFNALASRSPGIPMSVNSPANTPGGGQNKRISKTPIIVIPSALTSLINMLNVKDLLQNLTYISADAKKAEGVRRETDVLIHRRRYGSSGGPTAAGGGLGKMNAPGVNGVAPDAGGANLVAFRIIDNVSRLQQSDWDRVVAVFVQGPAWQFKGWPWSGNPVQIFAHIKAFHVKWSELPTDSNVKNWSVHVLALDRYKRHLDRATLQEFWDSLDRFMVKHKSHLRF